MLTCFILSIIYIILHLIGLKRDDLRLLKMVADSIGGLSLVEFRRPNCAEKQWKIVKE